MFSQQSEIPGVLLFYVSAKGDDHTKEINDRLVKLRVNVTLGGLVAAVASEHNYDAFVDAFLKDLAIPHIDQTDESDLLFLT